MSAQQVFPAAAPLPTPGFDKPLPTTKSTGTFRDRDWAEFNRTVVLPPHAGFAPSVDPALRRAA